MSSPAKCRRAGPRTRTRPRDLRPRPTRRPTGDSGLPELLSRVAPAGECTTTRVSRGRTTDALSTAAESTSVLVTSGQGVVPGRGDRTWTDHTQGQGRGPSGWVRNRIWRPHYWFPKPRVDGKEDAAGDDGDGKIPSWTASLSPDTGRTPE